MKRNHDLINNTVMLYILTFSTYFFNLITIPYQTRVLGPSYFAQINFAAAFVLYFQLIIDFGFVLSGTEAVAKNRNSIDRISRIYSAICAAKLVLIGIATAILVPLLLLYAPLRDNTAVILLYYIATCILAMFPDYLYRGMENMRSITVRNVLIKAFFTAMVFVVVRKPEDYLLIPFLMLIGNAVAMLITVFHVKKTFGVCLVRPPMQEVKDQLRCSSNFFYSRIASTIYSSTNTFIIGLLYGTASWQLAFFSSANKLVTTAKQGVTPITDSLYPYMVAEKNYGTLKKALLIFMPLITAACIIGFVLAYPICGILFGEEFVETGYYLRLLLPLIWLSLPAMLFGFPALSPLGLSKYVNYSNIIGAGLQIVLLGVGYSIGALDVVYICAATCITELCVTGYRIGVFLFAIRKNVNKTDEVKNGSDK